MKDYQMLIDGRWVDAKSGECIDVIDPATEEQFARVPNASNAEAEEALRAAQNAFPQWASLSPAQRGVYLWRASDILEERKVQIGRLMTREQGKTVKEAVGEVEKAVEMLRYYAEEAKRAYGQIIANADPMDQSLVVKQPVGVVVGLSAWNYPIELTGWKAAAALAAGCTIVAKPPSLTPLSPLEYWRCLYDSGIPNGVINAVTGPGGTVGRYLVQSPISRKVAFTGSLEVGLDIQRQMGNTIKKVSLELGGHCPLIVSNQCDIAGAVKGATRRSFRNVGQICVSINRIYIHESIYETFLSDFAAEARKLVIGNSLIKDDCDLGPMASLDGLQKVQKHVEDALSKGARLLCGGKKPEGSEYHKGYFYEPTILADTNHDMLVMTEESFGPIVGVMPFSDIENAVSFSNDTPYGLAAYVYTDNLHEMNMVTQKLEAGSVTVNNVDAGIMNAPFGGWKQSGVGHEHGHEGLEEYLNLKHIRIRYRKP